MELKNTDLNQEPHKPFVNSYKDAKSYLNDYFLYRKRLDDKFSYEIWSAELGYKSRSFLKMICIGSRSITMDFVRNFSDMMKFSYSEILHFRAISHISNLDEKFEKTIFTNKMLETFIPKETVQDLNDNDVVISSVTTPVIQMLVSFKDSPCTAEFMAEMTGLKIVDILNQLSRLEKIDLVEQKIISVNQADIKTWIPKVRAFKISKDQQDKTVKDFHKATFIEAKEKLDCPDPQKSFRSIFIPIGETQFDDLSVEVDQFMTRIKNKYGDDYLNNKKLVKLNLQVYPLTSVYKK